MLSKPILDFEVLNVWLNLKVSSILFSGLKKLNKKVPHIEYERGMYGYEGKCDYSDFYNLKEYVLQKNMFYMA